MSDETLTPVKLAELWRQRAKLYRALHETMSAESELRTAAMWAAVTAEQCADELAALKGETPTGRTPAEGLAALEP